jgi:hypothetical protein
MPKRRVPRWINFLWLGLILGITSSYVMVALRHGYDFVQTLGFLVLNFGNIFAMFVLAGLLLYGLSIFFRPARQAGEKEPPEDHSGDMANLVP